MISLAPRMRPRSVTSVSRAARSSVMVFGRPWKRQRKTTRSSELVSLGLVAVGNEAVAEFLEAAENGVLVALPSVEFAGAEGEGEKARSATRVSSRAR